MATVRDVLTHLVKYSTETSAERRQELLGAVEEFCDMAESLTEKFRKEREAQAETPEQDAPAQEPVQE